MGQFSPPPKGHDASKKGKKKVYEKENRQPLEKIMDQIRLIFNYI